MSEAFLDFELGGTLGKGAFGRVRKAVHRPTGQRVAVKFLMKSKIRTVEDRKRVERETAILKKIQHPNLLQLLQVAESEESIHLITELVEGEELYQKINRVGKLDESTAALYFMQLLDAVSYLQNLGICHRDIKPENIIVRGNLLKLIDFGLSNFYREGELLKTSCGSPCYAAPEMMSEKRYDPKKTEVWALGATLYAMLTGRLPFQSESTSVLYKLMATGEYEEVQGVSSSLKSLIRAMIEPNPSLRIDIEDIHSHVWVRSQNYTFHTSSPMQWNNERLQQLEGMFALSREELKSRITKAFGPERVYYFLSDKKKSTGPLHLSFAFFSLRAAQTEANRKFPDANWTSPVTAETSSQLLVIKSQNGIYSLCLE